MSRAFEYAHVVLFADTNLVGNVYFVNYIAWQGACRERFLYEHAPSVLDELRDGLALVTVSCHCDYISELSAFDEVIIRMSLVEAVQNRLDLRFDYVRRQGGRDDAIAVGRQRIACMRRSSPGLVPTSIPPALLGALDQFR